MAARTRNSSDASAGAAHRKDGNGRTRKLRRHGREVRTEGEALLHATQGALRELNQVVGEQLEVRPYATLGTAFGFGLFLGGGLPFGVVRFTARAAAGILVRQAIAAALPSADARA